MVLGNPLRPLSVYCEQIYSAVTAAEALLVHVMRENMA
jgi:hypothetical protein